MDALAKLYTYDKQFDKTLDIWLRLKRGNVFELIRQHSLYESIQDKVVLLMEFDTAEAVKMLVSNTDKIPIAQVFLLVIKGICVHIYQRLYLNWTPEEICFTTTYTRCS